MRNMPLVGKVGSRRPRARLAMAILYVVLAFGAALTIYPFLTMVATGMKGPTDQNDSRLVPRYVLEPGLAKSDPDALYGKYLDDKYSGNLSLIASTRTGGRFDPRYRGFLESLPGGHWLAAFRTAPSQATGRLTMRYQAWLRGRFASIDDLNRAYIEENVAFQTVSPPNELLDRKGWRPIAGRKWDDWLDFKATLPAEFRIPIREQRLYQEYLRAKTENQFDRLPAELRSSAAGFEQVTLPEGHPTLEEFRRSFLPDQFSGGDTVETRWARLSEGPLPIDADERAWVSENSAGIAREFGTRNFRYVLDYVAVNGRALWNTVAFCLLAILVQLTVNPVAAYALSRYPMRATAKILIFLLATMAFPAEVAMIPSFLLLKDLGLLNTFAALVLPTAASGYMIFLLKGFFDSLPREVFESGQIDGAREATLMTRIAFPLSKPVLGYLALLAFMGAYGAFLYAFLVAQDQRMWTLMVWIYQLQLTAPKSVVMAALALAAVPTLAVFLVAQRVIMRGIVLPGER